MYHILIIDDNEKVCKSLQKNFSLMGHNTDYFINGEEALSSELLFKADVILLDISLHQKYNGIQLLEKIRLKNITTPIIMITGYGSIENAVECMKKGADDFVQKPVDINHLLNLFDRLIISAGNPDENYMLEFKSEKMIALMSRASRIAAADIPVLITGESGTGKEILADFIHSESKRSSKDMIKINCAAIPENLLDSELFGHTKGSFTGAENDFEGVFEQAYESTLLLDEIGDMHMNTQAKILRAIQNAEIRPLGSGKTVSIDVRFIASTNKDPQSLISQGLFREDLYFRLNSATLNIPPLREHPEDIIPLSEFFLKQTASDKNFSEETLNILQNYNWPGNIRELKNSIQYAAAIGGNPITVDDLPKMMQLSTAEAPATSLSENEKKIIKQMLEDNNYNKKKTAEALKISRKTLYNKMEKYNL